MLPPEWHELELCSRGLNWVESVVGSRSCSFVRSIVDSFIQSLIRSFVRSRRMTFADRRLDVLTKHRTPISTTDS